MEECARAHGKDFVTDTEEGIFFIPDNNIPLLADILAIARGFYGGTELVDCNVSWKYICVELNKDEMLPDYAIDWESIDAALPYKAINNLN